VIDYSNADFARNSLRHVLVSLLRLNQCTPEDLRERGLRSFPDRSPQTTINVALRALRTQVAAIKGKHDQITSEKIISEAIVEACATIENERGDRDKARFETAMTLRATITRQQFPVGHGNFHAGRIKVLRSRPGSTDTIFDQSYAYDCGSENPEAFAYSIEEYRKEYAEQLEFLFVSHLHADHINGLDRLLGYEVPRIVVLPYLDLEDMASMALRDFGASRFSGLYREYVRDPVAWWHGRGVEIVIFIEPGGDDDVAPESSTPDGPTGGGDVDPGQWRYEQPMVRLAALLHKPIGSVPAGLTAATPGVVDARQLGPSPLLAGSESLFRLEWKSDVQDAWRSGDWCLVPYVHPVSDEKRSAFRGEILTHLKLTNPSPKDFQEMILSELSSSANARALVDIYGNHFQQDHNVVSMSLYSGPAASETKTNVSRARWQSKWILPKRNRVRDTSSIPSGWLGTGDSMLKQKKRRSPWRKFYSRYDASIGALNLPHHGSILNFDDEVLAWKQLKFALATTEQPKSRIAGIATTLKSVELAHKLGVVVDDKPTNTVTSQSERELEVTFRRSPSA
jgi:hypothetical protein